jgi:CO dehydrogenase/acetyl-CoA synthase gamma subunit (corrinoid Fe-S protein)
MTPSRLWCTVTVVGADGTGTSWSVHGHGAPTLAVVDQIAALELHARHHHGAIVLDSTCAELGDLLDLTGLRELVGVQVHGQSESRENRCGVEEKSHLRDLPS